MIGKMGFILEAARKRISRFFATLQDHTVITNKYDLPVVG